MENYGIVQTGNKNNANSHFLRDIKHTFAPYIRRNIYLFTYQMVFFLTQQSVPYSTLLLTFHLGNTILE